MNAITIQGKSTDEISAALTKYMTEGFKPMLAATWNKPIVGIFSPSEFGALDVGRCEGIAKAHGGDLKVETKEGEGSSFTIEISVNPATT